MNDRLNGKGGYITLILFVGGILFSYIGFHLDVNYFTEIDPKTGEQVFWNIPKVIGIMGLTLFALGVPILVYHLHNLKPIGKCKCDCHEKGLDPMKCGWCGHTHV